MLASVCLCVGTIGPIPLCPHSPSGCTFWGKRPWSRTRKILWQLGMVLGAPVVISIVAGIAVPVITIGLPIYMGRKVLALGFPWSCSLLSLAAHGQRPGQIHSAQHCPLRVPMPPFFPHSPSLWGTYLLSTPTPLAGEGVLYVGRWGHEQRSVWARVLSEDT